MIARIGSARARRPMLAVVLLTAGVVPAQARGATPGEAPDMALPDVASPSSAVSAPATEAVAANGDAATDESMDGLASQPRWEFGVGAGYLEAPAYPASASTSRGALALPYFIYRSPLVRLDGGGLRAVALENPRLKLDLSVAGSLSASSDDTPLRDGMPDLDYLVEIGPQLTLILSPVGEGAIGRSRIALSLRLRAVVSTDLRSIERRGAVFETALSLREPDLFSLPLDLVASARATAGSEGLNDYFYAVRPAHARTGRPAFDGRAGYIGARLSLGLSWKPRDDLRVVAGINEHFHAGAANTDSPLFETRRGSGVALALVWQIRESRERVRVLDVD